MISSTIYLPGWIEPVIATKVIEKELKTKNGKIKRIKAVVPKYRYCVFWGGRGSGKTYGIADLLLLLSCQKQIHILCSRSIKGTIEDSVHATLELRINDLGLSKYFRVTRDKIVCIKTGSKFIFKGLLRNIDGLKGLPRINYVWIEEADSMTRAAWEVLVPGVRADNSQILITMNPKFPSDCIYEDFISDKAQAMVDEDAYVKYIHWSDNPYFGDILNKERLRCLSRNPGMYQHIWEGALLEHTDAQIFKGCWLSQEFEDLDEVYAYYYGLDYGYRDPTAAIRCYIHNNILYISHEFYKVQMDIPNIGIECDKVIPGFKNNKIVADSSRPETIAFMYKQGYNIEGAIKGKGSIEDGIAFIRSFDKVIIHPRCSNVIREFTLYSYKVDPRSGDITNSIEEKNNHSIDALRYALERVMKRNYVDYDILCKL